MEKLIYVCTADGGGLSAEAALDRVGEAVVPAVRAAGGERMAVFLPDLTDQIRAKSPFRIGGAFDSLVTVFEAWLPSLDARGGVEEALGRLGASLWGYLVTESTVVACPHSVGDGERVPGVSQWGMNDKPAKVELEDFYREWQVVHSKLSFDLHPEREAYIRNAVARKLTPDTPDALAIVVERFPSLEVFTDDARYFGDPKVVKEMIDHLPTFYEPSTAITGGTTEVRFA